MKLRRPRSYLLFDFASRAKRNARSRCIFLTAAPWRSASSLSASLISVSRRRLRSNKLSAHADLYQT
jgi:hypothetical protein